MRRFVEQVDRGQWTLIALMPRMISLQITVTLHLTSRVAFADRAVSPNFS